MTGNTVETSPDARRVYWAALWVSLSAACLFCGYELVRSPANTLFKVAYGKAGLPYAMAATPVAVVGFLWVYGRLLTRFGPRRTLILTTLGSCGILAGCCGRCNGGPRRLCCMSCARRTSSS